MARMVMFPPLESGAAKLLRALPASKKSSVFDANDLILRIKSRHNIIFFCFFAH
jgi:hypothetical protein